MKFYKNVEQVGNKILVRAHENGTDVQYREDFKPSLFVSSNKEVTDYKSLDGRPLRRVMPGSIADCRNFVQQYADIDEFEIHGNTRYLYQYINEKYPGDEIKFDSSLIRVFTIDIETAAENGFPDIQSADQEILLISLRDSFTNRITVWGSKAFKNEDRQVDYIHCDDETKLLHSFLGWWQENFPDVITGWNVQLFDIPYICRRMTRMLGDKYTKMLSPWKMVSDREIYIKGRKQIAYDIPGISCLDYLELYKKFTYTNQESYRLDHIAFVELEQKKLDHSEFDTFKEFYTNDWHKFVEYNIHDVRLVDRLDDKMKLLELAFTMAYDAKVNFEDVYSQVRMWDAIIYNYLEKQKIAIPPKQNSHKDAQYAGAYVKEPIPGMYDWVVSFDLNSLYPHLIMQYNLSPETLLPRRSSVNVDMLLDKDFDTSDLAGETLCANGTHYTTKEQGFLPKLMEKIYQDRTIYKKKMLAAKQQYEKTPTIELKKEIARCNNIQMARKIQLNSAYGAIGNEHFRYYKLEIAEAITLSGQLSIRWIEKKMNEYLNKLLSTKKEDYVIASDTDSIYLNLGPLVNKFFSAKSDDKAAIVSILDKICQDKLEPFIESSYQALANYVSAYDQKMQMKRENIADRGIWTAKKRYILNVWNSEGVAYAEPKLKMMGIEAVKSSTPAPCRKMIKDALKLMMEGTEDDVIEFIEDSRKKFKELPPEQISFPRSVSDVVKYNSSSDIYKKGTPIHVRGALLFNHYIKQKKLTNKYSLIQNGEKIKFCYLKSPNPMRENVISFIQEFPKELDLDKYIDYELQFEKSFLEPLKSILDAIGWSVEKTVNLEMFFS